MNKDNSGKCSLKYSLLSKHRLALFGIASLLICYFHYQPQFFQSVPKLRVLERFCGTQALVGVDIFVMLSSYGLAHFFAKGNFSYKNYLKRRFSRVYPQMMIMNVVYALIYQRGIWYVLAGVVLLIQPIYGYYAQLWYLPFILVMYLLAPLYYFGIYRRFSNKTVGTAAMMALTAAAAIALRPWINGDWYVGLMRIPAFLLGFLWGDWAVSGRKCSLKAMLASVAAMLAGLTLNMLYGLGRLADLFPYQACLINLLIAPGLAMILALFCDWLSKAKNGLARGLTSVLLFYGKISLEFYCVQERTYELIRVSVPMGSKLTALAAFLLSTALGAAMYWGCGMIVKLLFTTLPERWRASRT